MRATRRRLYAGSVSLPSVSSPVPADLYVWPSPRTYTGQHIAELHLISCPPLLDIVVAQVLEAFLNSRA